MAKDMIKEPDLFIDLQKMDSVYLDGFSHIFQQHTVATPSVLPTSNPAPSPSNTVKTS
jgi:hypothetical protein